MNKKKFLKLLAVTAAMSWCWPAAAQRAGSTYDEILAGAAKEGKLVVWMTLPTQPATHRAVAEAFNKRFNLNTAVEWEPLAAPTANTRAISEAAGRKLTVDVIGGGTLEEVNTVSQAGLVKPFAWGKVFGKAFPEIARIEGNMPEKFRGIGLPYLEAYFGIAWNPQAIKDQDVPNKLADLLDPKWKTKFAFNAFFLVPLDTSSIAMGEEAAVNFARQLLANQPVLLKGSPPINHTVVSGQVPFGMTLSSLADSSMRAKEPMKFKLLADYIPVSDVYLYPMQDSPNPNTALLFSAWFASEGYKVADALEPSSNASEPDNRFRKMAEAQTVAGAKVVRIRSMDDVERIRRVRQAISLMLSGQK